MDSEKVWKLAVPTLEQLLVSLFLAGLGEIIVYRDAIAFKLASLANIPTGSLQQGSTQVVHGITAMPLPAQILVVLFWATIGGLIYLVALSLHASFIDAHNVIAMQTEFTQQGPWATRVRRASFQGLAGLLVVIVVALSALFLVPLWTINFGALLSEGSLSSSLSAIMLFFGFSINIYLIWMLTLLTLTLND